MLFSLVNTVSAADKLQTMELHYNCLVEVPVIRPGIDLKVNLL